MPHFFSSDCLKILFNVPGARSSLGFPATVTRPGFEGCLNCLWLPRVATRVHPSSLSIRSISLTFIVPEYQFAVPRAKTQNQYLVAASRRVNRRRPVKLVDRLLSNKLAKCYVWHSSCFLASMMNAVIISVTQWFRSFARVSITVERPPSQR